MPGEKRRLTSAGGRSRSRIAPSPSTRGAPKKRSASAAAKPAICTASSQAEIRSARLICALTGAGSSAGSPKRMCTARASRASSAA